MSETRSERRAVAGRCRTAARWSRAPWLCGAALALAVAALYLDVGPANPPGFHLDESSIAYNAAVLATTGADEYGASWPLYFRCLGDYKSPGYLYLLALTFTLFGPGVLVARALSALLGLLAAAALGLLASRLSGRPAVGAIVALSAALTPCLFEVSRLVYEVALVPLAATLFLLALWRAHGRERWSLGEAATLAATLALASYSYSLGKALGPMWAAGLILFVDRRRAAGIAAAWLFYAIALLPMAGYALRHPLEFGARFQASTFVVTGMTPAGIAGEFLGGLAANLDLWRWVREGDPIERHHVAGLGSLLAPTAVLALAGLVLVLTRAGRDPWWRFVIYAALVAAVPASLTSNRLHTLRLVTLPILLLVLTVPALAWLLERAPGARPARAALAGAVAATVLAGALFQWTYRELGPLRGRHFDSGYREVLLAALATGRRPIYLLDPTYIHAYWYGLLAGVERSRFVQVARGEAPPGGLFVGLERPWVPCGPVARRDRMVACIRRAGEEGAGERVKPQGPAADR